MTNPYFNAYNQYANAHSQYSQPYQQKQEIIKVNGEGGAKAYQMPPNSSVLLLDESNPIVWLKQTDGAGYPSLSAFTITPYKPENITESLEKRIKRLEEMYESNFINAKQPEYRESDITDKSDIADVTREKS